MIRIKVVKGAQLLVIAAAGILAAVILTLVLLSLNGQGKQAEADTGTAAMVAVPIVKDQRKPPRILLYHTHTCEAYAQDAADPYQESEKWRTRDASHSVVRVGDALAEALRRRGVEVVHDTTDHEGDSLSTAYTRSLETLEIYGAEFDYFIDLHRDAHYDGAENRVQSGNVVYARLMFMIGRGDKYMVKPDFEGNYDAARAITDGLNREIPGLCADVLVREGRYNQHVGRAALIEVGDNDNTLGEALATMDTLAEAISQYLYAAIQP